MSRYFIHMAFDGTAYSGWQIQPNETTVQQVLEHALTTLLREEVSVTGAGRTDTGVHASFFMAHFDLPEPGSRTSVPDPGNEQFVFRLNRFLPHDIVVYKIIPVPPDLHARFSALYRTYHYHVSSTKPLYNRKYCHYVYGELDLDAIRQCCAILLETSDFTSFARLHTDVRTNRCHVMQADWNPVDQGYLFVIKADRFLRNMVRSITGTLLDVGQGKLGVAEFRDVVQARDRGQAGQSAPARGLFLVDIGYEPLDGIH